MSNRAAAGKPLVDHLEDFRKSLGDTTKHAKQTTNSIFRMYDACKFKTWSDISASRLFNYLADLKNKGDISQRTFNFNLKAAKQFCTWMVKDRRASTSPIEHRSCETITDHKRQRRAITADELRYLLENTKASETRFGMTGYERALLYRLATETGLRANELRSLKNYSFDFTNLTVSTAQTKNKRTAVLPLRAGTAAELKEFFEGKLPTAKAFGGTYNKLTDKTSKMLQNDLEGAGIDYVDDSGRYFDFHALRGECSSLLAAAGVHPRLVQSIMRHSDINLTMNAYTHTFRGQESEAIENLPDLSLPSRESQKNRKTGTDDFSVSQKTDLASCSAYNNGFHHTPIHCSKQPDRTDEDKNRVFNGRYRARTCDPLIKSQLLYQLS